MIPILVIMPRDFLCPTYSNQYPTEDLYVNNSRIVEADALYCPGIRFISLLEDQRLWHMADVS